MKREYREDRLMYHPFCGENPPPPPRLGDISAEVRRYLRTQGMTGSYHPDPKTARKVQTIIDRLWELFPYEITAKIHPPIHGVTLYDRMRCSDSFADPDGLCVWNTTSGVDGYSVICVDRSAVEDGEEYFTIVFLHEFAHAIAPCPGGNAHFTHYEAKLEELILNYNSKYGTNIRNDHVTFNDEQRKMNRVEIEAKETGVPLWRVAEELAIPEDDFIAMMNRTLSQEAEAKMLQVIQKLRPGGMKPKDCNTTR